MAATIGSIIIGMPLIFLLWHIFKTEGKRPDGYTDISARPIIPAVVIDINMPFSSMVVFMTKLALASIPAIMLITISVIFRLSGFGCV